MKLVDAKKMRQMDRLTIEQCGIPGLDLMEKAGGHTAKGMLDKNLPDGLVLVLCGSGNNGGDGFVVARHLVQAKKKVCILFLGSTQKLSADARANFDRLPDAVELIDIDANNLDLAKDKIKLAKTIVDGLLGTGLLRNVSGNYATIINTANKSKAQKIALDIPSGISSDSGQIMGMAFKADYTYTYGFAKIGSMIYPGAEYSGRLTVVDIGIPASVADSVGFDGLLLNEREVGKNISNRKPDCHKGSFGHLLIVAGSLGKGGAAILSAHAALRSGAGLVSCLTNSETRLALLAKYPEVMSKIVDSKAELHQELERITHKKTAAVIGPGWGISEANVVKLKWMIESFKNKPLLLDADALNLAAKIDTIFFDKRFSRGDITVLTPHPGEAARLLKLATTDIQMDRPSAAIKLAKQYKSFVVLKGARSIIADPFGLIFICPFGNAAMASAGVGDCLSGLVGGLLAASYEPLQALIVGVCMHSIAGDLAARKTSMHSLMASDIIEEYASIFNAWEIGRSISLHNS